MLFIVLFARHKWNPQRKSQTHIKVCGCYSFTFLNWTPSCDSCVYWLGSKNKHHTDTHVLKEVGLRSQIYVKYSTLDSEDNWKDQCTQWRDQQACTSGNHNQIRTDRNLQPGFGRCWLGLGKVGLKVTGKFVHAYLYLTLTLPWCPPVYLYLLPLWRVIHILTGTIPFTCELLSTI